MRKIMISIALVAMMLTGCSQKEARTTAVEDVATNTIATVGDADTATTEEVVEEPAPEKETLEDNNEATTEVPATTEIGGGKKKAEETTEEKKPSTNQNNSVSTSSGQSTTPKPSNSGSNSGNSVSGNSGNSGSNNGGSNNSGGNSGNNNSNNGGSTAPATTEAPKPSTTEAPTTQHQHVYDQVVVDTPEQRIDYPEQGYYLDAVKCHICGQVFTSMEALDTHADHGAESYGSTTPIWVKTKDAYTEVIPAKTHRECKCGARE